MIASSAPNPPLRRAAAALGRHWAVLAALGLFLLAGLAVLDDYGVSPDESAHRTHGSAVIDYVLGNGDLLLRHRDKHHGVGSEMPLQFLERALRLEDSREVYLARHLLVHFFFLTGGLFIYLLAQRLFKSRLIALLAMLLFLLHPRLYAHSFVNDKDISFLSMFMIVLFLTSWAFRKDRLWAFALLGAGVGMLMNIRIMGAMLVPAVLTMRGLELLGASGPAERKRVLLSAGVFAIVGVLTLYAALPYLWSDPLGRFIESLARAANHSNETSELFRGAIIFSKDVPPDYVPIWFSVTTPPVALLFGALGASALLWQWARGNLGAFGDTRLRFGLFVLGCFITPILTVILLGSTLFNGWRHLFFLWAPFSLLAAFGLRWLVNRFAQPVPRALVYGAAGAGAAATAISMALLHPNQQVYFNFFEDRVTPDNLSARYVLDYWSLATFGAHDHFLDGEHPSATVQHRTDTAYRFGTLPQRDRERIRVVNSALPAFSVRTSRPDPGDDTLYIKEVYNNVIAALVREQPQENPFPAVYAAALSGEPIVRSVFDLYAQGHALIYVKEPCAAADLNGGFVLRFYPVEPDDLPDEHRGSEYEARRFHFLTHGALFDGKCVGQVPLPDYPVLNVRAYQYYGYANELYWEELFPLDAAEHYAAYESAAAREPAARAAFDLYVDEEDRTLIYAKEPCAAPDIERRFFAHVTPVSIDDLPEERREVSFDNLDFAFLTRGIVFDGKCAAILPLPEYGVASVRTGQFVSGEGEIWEAAVPFGS